MRRPSKQTAYKLILSVVILAGIVFLSGCRYLGFYGQAIHGQSQLILQRKSIDRLIAGADTPEALKNKLILVMELRDFAESHLELPTKGQYRKYVDIKRPYVVWNVNAAPEFSLESKSWWYPILGRLDYRGYFDEESAKRYARSLESKGFDVYVGGVAAYSTLGFFNDPVLSTFIKYPEADLAELLFHELAHQRVFAKGDTDFNEAFATLVAQEGVKDWYRSTGKADKAQDYARQLERERAFIGLIETARSALEALYESVEHSDLDSTRHRKLLVIDEFREGYQQFKNHWNGYDGYDRWMEGPLNNAQINSIDTYYDLVPTFRAIFEECETDWETFFQEIEHLANLKEVERDEVLEARSK